MKYDRTLLTEDSVLFDPTEMVGTSADIDDRVQELLTMFRLEHVADMKIGTARLGRAKSRLVTIAMELCNRPGF